MRKILAISLSALVFASGMFYFAVVRPALAGVSCSLPFTLTNGTIADASQVMSNYNALVTCLTNAAAAGANNDITSLSGLTTPLTPNQGGSNVYIGAAPTVSGNQFIFNSTTPSGWANTKGFQLVFVAPSANTTTLQFVVNGQATENVFKLTSGGPVALTGGEVVTNQAYSAIFDGTQFEVNPFPNVTAGWGISVVPTAVSINTANPPYGFDSCINMTISATSGSNLLGLQLFAADTGLAPTTSHPILCPFRDSTVASGDPVWLDITSAVYMDTNAAGATLGTQNSKAFKFWIVLFNNAGTPQLALWNSGASAVTPQVRSLNEGVLQSTTGISNSATSAGTFYTKNGVTLTNKAFRILGYLEYSTGLATAGSYTAAPTILQLFGPGIKKPGDIVKGPLFNISTIATQATSALQVRGDPTLSIAPDSAADLISIEADGGTGVNNSGTSCLFALSRGATYTSPTAFNIEYINIGAVTLDVGPHLVALDFPNSTSAQTYAPFVWQTAGSNCFWNSGAVTGGTPQGFIKGWEIQG